MKNLNLLKILAIILLLATFSSCSKDDNDSSNIPEPQPDSLNTNLDSLSFTVSEATDWTLLFKRNSGWFGGDGIFSIPFNGVDSIGAGQNTKTLIFFSDTNIGEIKNGVLMPGFKIINNSAAIIEGNDPDEEKINFYWDKDAEDKPKALFIPTTPESQEGDYYWLGDGFVNHEKGNATYVMAYKIKKVNTAFGFAIGGSSIIVIPEGSQPPFSDHRQIDAPLFVDGDKIDNGYAFGAGIFVNTEKAGAPNPDGYVYVYGVKNGTAPFEKNLMVSRVLPQDFEDFSKWRFWDGSDWSIDINNIKNAATITNRVSDELSVTPLSDGRYALVFQDYGIGKSVALRLSLSPVGPFGPVIKLFDCPEPAMDLDYFTYNAKAHPNLSKSGELLFSYNVNSFNFFSDIQLQPNLYRPRFIKIKFN